MTTPQDVSPVLAGILATYDAPSLEALVDQLFSGRILFEESEEARLLFEKFCVDMNIKGAAEVEIVVDVVLNRLVRHRLDKSLAAEFRKSHIQAAIDEVERRDRAYFRAPVDKGQNRDESPHPIFRVALLERLKARVEQNGADYDRDLRELNVIFGNRRTLLRGAIVARYFAAFGESGCENVKAVKTAILKAIDAATEGEKIRAELERVQEDLRNQPSTAVLPEQNVFGFLLEAVEENDRGFQRLLQNLKAIRSLERRPK